jgi:Protein of unknown function (DUF3631)
LFIGSATTHPDDHRSRQDGIGKPTEARQRNCAVRCDKAGGDWPDRARAAAVSLVTEAKDNSPSLGVRLLFDVRNLFGADAKAKTTEDILRELCKLDEAPWGDMRGKPLNDRGLAKLLKPYGINFGDAEVTIGMYAGETTIEIVIEAILLIAGALLFSTCRATSFLQPSGMPLRERTQSRQGPCLSAVAQWSARCTGS